jgi:hypothetical protein
VLIVSERPAPVVATALAERGMHVEMIAPRALATRVDGLAAYHLVILDDVARGDLGTRPSSVSPPGSRAVAAWSRPAASISSATSPTREARSSVCCR